MKKTRFKTVAVVVFVLTALTGLLLAGPGRGGRGQRGGYEFGPERPGRSGMGMGRHGGPGEMGMLRMLGRLELTDEQKESVKKITEAAKEKNKAADEAVGEARKALRESVDKGDEDAIRKAATSLGKVIGDQAVLKVQTKASIKKVLTPEQLKELEEHKAKMKERGKKFRGKMDSPRHHGRFRDSGRYRDFRRGYDPRGRGPNSGSWGHDRKWD